MSKIVQSVGAVVLVTIMDRCDFNKVLETTVFQVERSPGGYFMDSDVHDWAERRCLGLRKANTEELFEPVAEYQNLTLFELASLSGTRS